MSYVSDRVELGERVRRFRLSRGLSQDALGARVDLDGSDIAGIESGERPASALALMDVATALRTTLPDLVAATPAAAVARRRVLSEDPLRSEREQAAAELDLESALSDLDQLRGLKLLRPVRLTFAGHGLASVDQARELAVRTRGHLGLGQAPLPAMAEVAAQLGLWTRTTQHEIDGLSLSPELGWGVCVVGAAVEAGRRRMTVAHEIGHHLSGDTYTGTGHLSDDETYVNAFAAEFLLPQDVVRALGTASRDDLIGLAFDYRVSWSVVQTTARQLGLTIPLSALNRIPTHDDFMRVRGAGPAEDMVAPGLAPQWIQACRDACASGGITPRRAAEMSRGVLAS